jgi:ABC-type transport system involved in Fe-S cluster assembly fused permease/ATPase subunit
VKSVARGLHLSGDEQRRLAVAKIKKLIKKAKKMMKKEKKEMKKVKKKEKGSDTKVDREDAPPPSPFST